MFLIIFFKVTNIHSIAWYTRKSAEVSIKQLPSFQTMLHTCVMGPNDITSHKSYFAFPEPLKLGQDRQGLMAFISWLLFCFIFPLIFIVNSHNINFIILVHSY